MQPAGGRDYNPKVRIWTGQIQKGPSDRLAQESADDDAHIERR